MNCIEYVQRNHDFFNYELVGYDLNAHFLNGTDCFIVGTDDDLKGDNSFTIKGCSKVFYGNAILVKISKGGNLHKLQATKITVEDVGKVIDFNK